jgi:hypothetical protein
VGQEPNPQRGAVAVTVGGRRAVLVATLARLARLEDALGVTLSELPTIMDKAPRDPVLTCLEILSGGTLDRAFLDDCLMVDFGAGAAALRRCLILSFTGGEEPDEDDAAEADDPENPPTA